MSQASDTVPVARFNHRHEAEIAHGFLETAGIVAVLRADDGGGAFGAPLSYSLGSFAELLVADEDAESARKILSDAGYAVLDPDAADSQDDRTPDSDG